MQEAFLPVAVVSQRLERLTQRRGLQESAGGRGEEVWRSRAGQRETPHRPEQLQVGMRRPDALDGLRRES